MTVRLPSVRLWPRLVIVGLLHTYRAVVSPWYGPVCRFYPSCSEYALIAVHRHGVLRGSWLAGRRLLRCHPWNSGGVDLVPPVADRVGADSVIGEPPARHSAPSSDRRVA